MYAAINFIFYIVVTSVMLKIISYFRKEKEKFGVLLLTTTISTLALIIITLTMFKIVQVSLSILRILILFILPFLLLISYKIICKKNWSDTLITIFWVVILQCSMGFLARLM